MHDKTSKDHLKKQSLDKDLSKFSRLEDAGRSQLRRLTLPGLGVLAGFVGVLTVALATGWQVESTLIVTTILLGLYMGLGIGANDVANNIGPAVGAHAMTMTVGLTLAAICELGGALLVGNDVLQTVRGGILLESHNPPPTAFIFVMLAALLSAALWVHCATYLRAPVSTTHSIIGGILGAALIASGLEAINWNTVLTVTAGWMISPAFGALVGASLQILVMSRILEQTDKISAARTWVPILLAGMVCAFTNYLLVKGFNHIWVPQPGILILINLILISGTFFLGTVYIKRRVQTLENTRRAIRHLFRLPLIIAAALLSFAHGANDVANAIGPVAAILETLSTGQVSATSKAPLWVVIFGALSISAGLMLFGRRLVRRVGHEITRMNPVRAFCIALGATTTVLFASSLGLPVSTTHITIGALFGVGFAREFRSAFRLNRRKAPQTTPSEPITEQTRAPSRDQGFHYRLQAYRRRRLVRRSHLLTITSAWIITVPATASMSALLYMVLTILSAG